MMVTGDSWEDVEAAGQWLWPRFSPGKIACSCCGRIEICSEFMDHLSELREACGFPLLETSGYRCSAHNCVVSSTGGKGPHTTGRAVDIQISGKRADRLIELSYGFGFTGRGVHQTGPHQSRFIHLDMLGNGSGCPRPRMWSY
ncbi:MAG: D-Ala-D-Ala carboxypeptidase family metallohydrolase [Alphaproteobacteria bacterium]|nr:D-Ala-D-Ala carboxypeptidase family metallohydrolase [Alphaproteobacteria bacterium]